MWGRTARRLGLGWFFCWGFGGGGRLGIDDLLGAAVAGSDGFAFRVLPLALHKALPLVRELEPKQIIERQMLLAVSLCDLRGWTPDHKEHTSVQGIQPFTAQHLHPKRYGMG